jgi:hypothetical protein
MDGNRNRDLSYGETRRRGILFREKATSREDLPITTTLRTSVRSVVSKERSARFSAYTASVARGFRTNVVKRSASIARGGLEPAANNFDVDTPIGLQTRD